MTLRGRLPALAALVGLVSLAAHPALTGEKDPGAEREGPGLRLVVEPSSELQDLDRLRVGQRLAVALIERDCGFDLVRKEGEAELELRVRFLRWWEQERPGGAPRFDPDRGREVVGTEVELELRYKAALYRTGEKKPLVSQEEFVRRQAASSRNPMFDPRAAAFDRALDSIARGVSKMVCKELKRRRKDRSSRRREPGSEH